MQIRLFTESTHYQQSWILSNRRLHSIRANSCLPFDYTNQKAANQPIAIQLPSSAFNLQLPKKENRSVQNLKAVIQMNKNKRNCGIPYIQQEKHSFITPHKTTQQTIRCLRTALRKINRFPNPHKYCQSPYVHRSIHSMSRIKQIDNYSINTTFINENIAKAMISPANAIMPVPVKRILISNQKVRPSKKSIFSQNSNKDRFFIQCPSKSISANKIHTLDNSVSSTIFASKMHTTLDQDEYTSASNGKISAGIECNLSPTHIPHPFKAIVKIKSNISRLSEVEKQSQ